MDIVDLSKKAWNKVCNHRQSKAADRQPEPSGYVYEELRDTIRDSVVREFKRIAHKKKDTSDCTLVIYIPHGTEPKSQAVRKNPDSHDIQHDHLCVIEGESFDHPAVVLRHICANPLLLCDHQQKAV